MSSIPQSKEELMSAINLIFPKLMADFRSLPLELSRQCCIAGNVKGTQISASDTVAYLLGWAKLVLKWHKMKSLGLSVDFPETGYKWNQLGLLAEHFHRDYAAWTYEDLLNELESTINDVLTLITTLSNKELYEQAWYEQWTLGRMIQLNTSSPMKNIRGKIRQFKKSSKIP